VKPKLNRAGLELMANKANHFARQAVATPREG